MPEEKPLTKELRLKKLNGALLDAPIWEEHKRGSNWAAIIGVDPVMPGGLSRRFIERGRGVCKYLSEKIGTFDAVEFAGDYYTFSRDKQQNRWYGVVTDVTADAVVVVQYKDGLSAILAAEDMRKKHQAAVAAARTKNDGKQERVEKSAKGEEGVETEGGAVVRQQGEPCPVAEGHVAQEAPQGERGRGDDPSPARLEGPGVRPDEGGGASRDDVSALETSADGRP